MANCTLKIFNDGGYCPALPGRARSECILPSQALRPRSVAVALGRNAGCVGVRTVAVLADMDSARASATAVGVAVARGMHRSCDQPPWVLDDRFALQLAGPGWAAGRPLKG